MMRFAVTYTSLSIFMMQRRVFYDIPVCRAEMLTMIMAAMETAASVVYVGGGTRSILLTYHIIPDENLNGVYFICHSLIFLSNFFINTVECLLLLQLVVARSVE